MKRGVILVHVLILVAMMGFMAALTLKWTLSRHIAAKMSVEDNENRALLYAAQTRLFACLAGEIGWPAPTAAGCKKPTGKPFSDCLGGSDIGGRTFNYSVCARKTPLPPPPIPPCRVLIRVCEAADPACSAPSCT